METFSSYWQLQQKLRGTLNDTKFAGTRKNLLRIGMPASFVPKITSLNAFKCRSDSATVLRKDQTVYSRRRPVANSDVIVFVAVPLVLEEVVRAVRVAVLVESHRLALRTCKSDRTIQWRIS